MQAGSTAAAAMAAQIVCGRGEVGEDGIPVALFGALAVVEHVGIHKYSQKETLLLWPYLLQSSS